MKLQIHSDVHVEFADVTIPNLGADALILAGDIGTFGGQRDLRPWLARHCDLFDTVMMIPGNHEYYSQTVDDVEEILTELNLPGFVYLQTKVKQVGGLTFAGATLWTDLNKGDHVCRYIAGYGMNDYNAISRKGNVEQPRRKLTTTDTLQLHKEHSDFLVGAAATYGSIDVVVTHHLPTMQSHDVTAHGDDELKWAYGSDADHLIEHINPQLWVHGHTHLCKDYLHEPTGVRILSNQRGYQSRGYEENTGWNPDLIIEVLPREHANKKERADG